MAIVLVFLVAGVFYLAEKDQFPFSVTLSNVRVL